MDLLGDQLVSVFDFIDSGFDTTRLYYDPVKDVKVAAGELFERQGSLWCLRSASVPGDLCWKAIAVTHKRLYLETAVIVWTDLMALLKQESLPFTLEVRTRTSRFWIRHKTGRVVLVGDKPAWPKIGEVQLLPRCLSWCELKGLTPEIRHDVINLIDRMFTQSVFVEPPPAPAVPALPGMSLQLCLQVIAVQSLEIEQRPVLCLQVAGELEGEQKQGQRLQILFAMQRKILSLKGQELEQFVLAQVAEQGEPATSQLLQFVIAGKIKLARPSWTWKRARQEAQRLTVAPKTPRLAAVTR